VIFSRRLPSVRAWVLPALCLILVALYWAGLRGNFVFDDFSSIVDNPSLRLVDGSPSSLMVAATSGISGPLGRPLSMLSFAMNLYFFGEAPFSFKVVNLIIHLANAMLVFALVRQLSLLLEGGKPTQAWALAAGTAAVWAIHPANATPVLYVVQRMTSLSAFFALCALLLYLWGRQSKTKQGLLAIAGSILIFWPAAILSKETGLLLPIYIFLCEWLVLGTFRNTPKKVKWLALLAAVCALSLQCWANWDFINAGYRVRNFDLLERLMTQARVLWFYVGQLVLPSPSVFGLFHDDIAISRGLLAPPTTLLAIFGWLGITVLAFVQRVRQPLFAFAVFWFLASHALESTVFPLEIAYEHRNYIGSFAVFMWLGSLLVHVRANAQWLVPRLVLAGSFLVFCVLVTSMRSSQWADEFQRAQVEVADHPDSARANHQAAVATVQRTFESGGGNPRAYQMAQFYYKRAAELDQISKAPVIGLLYLDCATGAPKDPALHKSVLGRFSSAPFTHGDRGAVQNLSALLVEKRLCLSDQEVWELIEAALSNPSTDGSMRGMIYSVAMDYAFASLHSIPLALSYAQAAVASDPGSVALRINLTHVLLRANRVDDARREYMILAQGTHASRHGPALSGLTSIFEAMGKSADTTN
jgi:protein O-mannosyl-transferase